MVQVPKSSDPRPDPGHTPLLHSGHGTPHPGRDRGLLRLSEGLVRGQCRGTSRSLFRQHGCPRCHTACKAVAEAMSSLFLTGGGRCPPFDNKRELNAPRLKLAKRIADSWMASILRQPCSVQDGREQLRCHQQDQCAKVAPAVGTAEPGLPPLHGIPPHAGEGVPGRLWPLQAALLPAAPLIKREVFRSFVRSFVRHVFCTAVEKGAKGLGEEGVRTRINAGRDCGLNR